MTDHEHDEDVRRLRAAEEELRVAQRRGARLTPMLNNLHKHLSENRFAERFVAALEHDVRRHA
jgi:hypothetical protein